MACGAKALFNRGVYYPLAGEILVAMAIEADVIGVQQPVVVCGVRAMAGQALTGGHRNMDNAFFELCNIMAPEAYIFLFKEFVYLACMRVMATSAIRRRNRCVDGFFRKRLLVMTLKTDIAVLEQSLEITGMRSVAHGT